MRLAYLDCFAGIAGDMFLGALLDAGVPVSVLEAATAALNLGASLKLETVDRSGISSTKVHVLEHGELAEARPHMHSHEPAHSAEDAHTHAHHAPEPETPHRHSPGHSHTHDHDDGHEHKHDHGHGHKHDHDHKHDHKHSDHSHPHVHGRSLTQIRQLIQQAELADAVKDLAIGAFELLGRSEAKIHNVPVDQIHFHEVGAVDAIVDIVAASAGIHHLQIDRWYASAVNVGGGMVECAHGTFPVPAPATADLLRGLPTYSAHIQKELVTPTGAALLRALNPTFGQQPPMRVQAIGYGAGTRNPKQFPNVLRLSLGEEETSASTAGAGAHAHAASTAALHAPMQNHGHDQETLVTVLETAVDDASPQLLAYVAERALAEGALDVMLTPVLMKKGRPGTLITILSNPAAADIFEQLLLRETPTLGVRIRQDRRVCLERRHTSVETTYGTIRVKIGSDNGQERNIAPEFEDCRAAAAKHGVPLKLVQQAAVAAYRR